jgi:hypothetical protein
MLDSARIKKSIYDEKHKVARRWGGGWIVKMHTCGLNVLLIYISLSLCELYLKFCVFFGLEHASRVTVLRRYTSSTCIPHFLRKRMNLWEIQYDTIGRESLICVNMYKNFAGTNKIPEFVQIMLDAY